MSDKEKHLLFITILSVIVLVNLILIYALFAHFALDHKVGEIGWLLSVFAAEIVGCTVVAWRKIINSEATPIISSGEVDCKPIVIEKSAVLEDTNNADVIFKETGRKFLIRARDKTRTIADRKECAKRAIEIFSQISAGSPAYHSAIYNIATAYRILGDFEKSLSLYQKVRKLIRAAQYTENDKRLWEADIEMMSGEICKDQGMLEQAETAYFNAWKLDPSSLVRTLNLYEITVRLGKREGAQVWAEILSKHQNYSSVSHLIENQAEITPRDNSSDRIAA